MKLSEQTAQLRRAIARTDSALADPHPSKFEWRHVLSDVQRERELFADGSMAYAEKLHAWKYHNGPRPDRR